MIVVTGGGGFIGSVLAAHLNESGHADLVIVDLVGGHSPTATIAKLQAGGGFADPAGGSVPPSSR